VLAATPISANCLQDKGIMLRWHPGPVKIISIIEVERVNGCE
jgi:hypothetical protein